MKNAIISVYNKGGLDKLVKYLVKNNFNIWSSGGTYRHISSLYDGDIPVLHKIEEETNFPEILGGRVKTLNPRIYGGILADREKSSHTADMRENELIYYDLVVVNLYPFEDTVRRSDCTEEDAIENIDIGGVSLIRAAAKNYKYLSVLTDERQYEEFINMENTIDYRRVLAREAFRYITRYDREIASYFDPKREWREYHRIHDLKYGLNPSQKMASVASIEGSNLPFSIVNGNPGYINMIDMIQSWRLVLEVTALTGNVAVTSFKHTTPTGLALGTMITGEDRKYFQLSKDMNSLVAIAYLRARDVDPLSSFGDFVAVSGIVDYDTAMAIRPEVTDGIIALGYEPEALEILKKKKGGKYIIILGKSGPPTQSVEYKEYGGGLCLIEDTCKNIVSMDDLEEGVCTKNTNVTPAASRNMILANTLLKYTPSNSVAFAYKDMVLGVGAGQQNRVDCVRLAGDKYQNWLLRHHPQTVVYRNECLEERSAITGKRLYKRQTVVNMVYEYVADVTNFNSDMKVVYGMDRKEYLDEYRANVTVASDGFFPFPDGIEVANEYNAKYIIQPGGSVGDSAVTEAADRFGMTMVMTGKRMFFH